MFERKNYVYMLSIYRRVKIILSSTDTENWRYIFINIVYAFLCVSQFFIKIASFNPMNRLTANIFFILYKDNNHDNNDDNDINDDNNDIYHSKFYGYRHDKMWFTWTIVIDPFFNEHQHEDTGQGRREGHHVCMHDIHEKLRVKLKWKILIG
jgi:hypothetical protein